MDRNNIHTFACKDEVCDPLHDIIRSGARELLAQAITAEVDEFIAAHTGLRLKDGRARLVRHGFLPARYTDWCWAGCDQQTPCAGSGYGRAKNQLEFKASAALFAPFKELGRVIARPLSARYIHRRF